MKSFEQYLESMGHSNKARQTHHRHLFYFINWCTDENTESEQATYREILGYIKYLQSRQAKQRTIQLYINSLRHYFKWLVKRQVRQEDPTVHIHIKGIKRKSLYDILHIHELENLYQRFELPGCDAVAGESNDLSTLTAKRNKAMLGLMIWQGAGTPELSALEIKDLKIREGKIRMPGSRRSNERELKLEAHQVLDLMEYSLKTREALLARYGKNTEQLFISNGTGANKLHNAIQNLVRKLHEINPRISSTRQIRTSVITYWLKLYNLRQVQYMAGHRFVSSTEAYLVNDLDDLLEDVNKFHPIG